MNFVWALPAPLAVQTAAMGIDEFHYHRKRGLGPWERIGHPLDTVTVLACIAWALFTNPTPPHVAFYLILAAFSCVFITKDEFVHARRCTPGEHWIHALLFVVHPLGLASVGLLWATVHAQGSPAARALGDLGMASALAGRLLTGQWLVTTAFCVYQIVYWNAPWLKRSPASR